MSEQPQHPSDPQGPDQDLLNEMMDRAATKGDPPSEPPAETPPSPPPPEKNRRSSVYVYLAVLFGAAFLMLLLAYFVQQRNNATAMDDLRMTTNVSREELIADLRRLETEKEGLEVEKETLQAQVDALQQQLDEQTDQNFWLERELEDQALSWKAIYDLEEDFRTEDYDGCVLFFDNTLHAIHIYTPPEAAPRVEEIYRELVEKGILNEEDYPLSTILGTPTNQ